MRALMADLNTLGRAGKDRVRETVALLRRFAELLREDLERRHP